MPTPVTVTRTGTGWTVDVSSLVLSTNLGYKDFFVRAGGVVSPLSSYNKVSPSVLNYSGVALAANTTVVVWRDSNRLVDSFAFADINTSAGHNLRKTQIELVLEDLRQMVNP